MEDILKRRVVSITSFKVFGIKVDNNQTKPEEVNRLHLESSIDYLIENRLVERIVIIKKWV